LAEYKEVSAVLTIEHLEEAEACDVDLILENDLIMKEIYEKQRGLA